MDATKRSRAVRNYAYLIIGLALLIQVVSIAGYFVEGSRIQLGATGAMVVFGVYLLHTSQSSPTPGPTK